MPHPPYVHVEAMLPPTLDEHVESLNGRPCSDGFMSVLGKLQDTHAAEVAELVREISQLRDKLGHDLTDASLSLTRSEVVASHRNSKGGVENFSYSATSDNSRNLSKPRVSFGAAEVQSDTTVIRAASESTWGGDNSEVATETGSATLNGGGSKLRRMSTFDDDMAKRRSAQKTSEKFLSARRLLEDNVSFAGRVLPHHLYLKLHDAVFSMQFQTFFGVAIIANSAFLGLRVDYRCTHPDEDPAIFRGIEYTFTVLFTVELLVRLAVEGCYVFCSSEKMHWYYLDLFVVTTSLLEVVLEIINQSTNDGLDVTNTRMFRVIRIVRLIKIVRIARVVKFVRALRTLVLSIVHTMRSVLWAFLLLGMIIYVFSLIFVQYVQEHIREHDTVEASLRIFWGTLPRSMFTLFKSIASGISWHEVVAPLSEVDVMLVALFVIFISFTLFAVLNVITGVFCEAAIEGARQDQEMVIQQHLAEREKFTLAMFALFGVDKEDNEHVLSYNEFECVLADPKTKNYLAAIQLDVTDAWELFKLLDHDESALIDVEEFIRGCLRLKGMAKAIDLAKLDYENKIRAKRLAKQILSLERGMTKLFAIVQQQNSQIRESVRESLEGVSAFPSSASSNFFAVESSAGYAVNGSSQEEGVEFC